MSLGEFLDHTQLRADKQALRGLLLLLSGSGRNRFLSKFRYIILEW